MYCTKCGKKIEVNDGYCPACGEKLMQLSEFPNIKSSNMDKEYVPNNNSFNNKNITKPQLNNYEMDNESKTIAFIVACFSIFIIFFNVYVNDGSFHVSYIDYSMLFENAMFETLIFLFFKPFMLIVAALLWKIESNLVNIVWPLAAITIYELYLIISENIKWEGTDSSLFVWSLVFNIVLLATVACTWLAGIQYAKSIYYCSIVLIVGYTILYIKEYSYFGEEYYYFNISSILQSICLPIVYAFIARSITNARIKHNFIL